MLSRTGTLALRALTCLAKLAPEGYAGATAVARQLDAPANYLGKLLQQFAQDGLIDSRRGYRGGFRLRRDPAEVTLYDVVAPLEQLDRWEGCILGRERCTDAEACALHARFARIRDDYVRMLRETTLADLAAG